MKNLLLALLITGFAFGADTTPSYSCDMQEDGTCLIDMSTILDEDIYNQHQALLLCESFDGMYIAEEDTCVID